MCLPLGIATWPKQLRAGQGSTMRDKIEREPRFSQGLEIIGIISRIYPTQLVDIDRIRIEPVLVEIPRIDSKAIRQFAALPVAPTIKQPAHNGLPVGGLLVMPRRVRHVLCDLGTERTDGE